MFRTSDIVLFAVMVSAAAFTYKTKQDVQREYEGVRRLEAQIRLEHDSIDVLKADWSLLTNPARLEKLVQVFQGELKLQPTDPHQFVTVDQVPARPVEVEDRSPGPVSRMAEREPDRKTITGGIAR